MQRRGVRTDSSPPSAGACSEHEQCAIKKTLGENGSGPHGTSLAPIPLLSPRAYTSISVNETSTVFSPMAPRTTPWQTCTASSCAATTRPSQADDNGLHRSSSSGRAHWLRLAGHVHGLTCMTRVTDSTEPEHVRTRHGSIGLVNVLPRARRVLRDAASSCTWPVWKSKS